MSKNKDEFSRFGNSQISSDSMATIVGGYKVGPWGETVAHHAYPDGDSGRENSNVDGGIEKDDKK